MYFLSFYFIALSILGYGFFLNHNFSEELEWGKWGKTSNEKWMNEIKNLVKNMEEENLKKSIKYFKNLTKICNLYYGKNKLT